MASLNEPETRPWRNDETDWSCFGLSKVLHAKKLTEFTGQTCVVIVRWTDFTGWINLREYKRIGWGGRTDRDDFQDLEPMAFFTASTFKAL